MPDHIQGQPGVVGSLGYYYIIAILGDRMFIRRPNTIHNCNMEDVEEIGMKNRKTKQAD